jgi:phospholipase A2
VHLAFPPAVPVLLTAAPTNKCLLRSAVEKMRANPNGLFGLVDVYGLLLAARLLVPEGELGIEKCDLKLSNRRAYVDGGRQPLPIYTAVRHEIPRPEVLQATAQNENEKASATDGTAAAQVSAQGLEHAKKTAKEELWFQWFEFTPYQLWCEELGAGIPTWAVRRQAPGANVYGADGRARPQLKMLLLPGMYSSAFCTTLGHFYQELRPLLQGLAGF